MLFEFWFNNSKYCFDNLYPTQMSSLKHFLHTIVSHFYLLKVSREIKKTLMSAKAIWIKEKPSDMRPFTCQQKRQTLTSGMSTSDSRTLVTNVALILESGDLDFEVVVLLKLKIELKKKNSFFNWMIFFSKVSFLNSDVSKCTLNWEKIILTS